MVLPYEELLFYQAYAKNFRVLSKIGGGVHLNEGASDPLPPRIYHQPSYHSEKKKNGGNHKDKPSTNPSTLGVTKTPPYPKYQNNNILRVKKPTFALAKLEER